MGAIKHKIWSDLWNNKGRTLQIVLIIAMGAFAIGMIMGSSSLMRKGLTSVWLASSPAMINLAVDPTIDDTAIQSLKNLRGLQDVEGYRETTIEWRLTPKDDWKPAGLIARDKYDEQKYAKLTLVSGTWPHDKVFAVDQGSDTAFGINAGGTIYIRVNDHIHEVKIGGVVYNPTSQPPAFGGNAQFYTTRDRMGQLTDDRNFNRVLAGAPVYDEKILTNLADRMERRLENMDVEAGGFFPGRVVSPEKHFFQDVLDGIFLVMGIMAVLALILGLFLVYNTINALISQQINQIGIMKAIGAKTGQILRTYLMLVFIYGLLALLIAAPLGAIGAYQLNLFLTSAFNATPDAFSVSVPAVLAQVVICLLSPLLASLLPILVGAGITVREAISTYGLSASGGRLGRWLANLQNTSGMLLLIISNTFRNKGRVILTQLTLVGSGLIFIMLMSVGDSVRYTFGDLLFSILKFDLSLVFEDSERIHQVETLTLAHPDVKAVEMWGFGSGKIRLVGQPETNDDKDATFFGVPVPTTLYGPQMRVGRWLQPTDTYAVVLNQKLAEKAGIKVGDWITLSQKLYGDSKWQVVGLLFDPIITDSAHVPRDVLLRETRSVGKASTVWIQTVQHSAAGQMSAAKDLRQYYDLHNLKLTPQGTFGRDTASEITQVILDQFNVIISMLAVMAIVIGAVGGIALSGVLSLSVLERRREIGVMRAIGASSLRIAGLFIGEGLFLGWLSWLIALPLSLPAGYLMAQALGAALQGEIVYKFTPVGALYWFGIVTVLSILASWLPARSATRVSVRESLAYQ